jgi:predicted lipid-binding transport protein (Tim44 family)
MNKYLSTIILSIILCTNMTIAVFAEDINESTIQNQNQNEDQLKSLGRGGYRSPAGSFTGGNRMGRDGYNTGPRAPSSGVTRNPRSQPAPQPAPASRLGGFLGGIATGALIGHFLNPFGGYGNGYGGGGFSLFSLLIWAVIIYFGFKLLQKLFRRRY